MPAPERGPNGGVVDWSAAERVASWLTNRRPSPPAYAPGPMQEELDDLTVQAETLVAEATGLHPTTAARGRVIDRDDWVRVNVRSIQRLLTPTLERLEARRAAAKPPGSIALRLAEPVAGVGRVASGAQLGAVLAWMSTRVLGQYDLLLTDEFTDDQDVVYYVGPNIVALEERYGFPSDEFRLWLALHEVTHRAQFVAVPWLRDHFVNLVDEGLGPLGDDPRRLVEGIRRAAEELRAGRSPFDDAGMLGLVATPEQLEAIRRIQALMSLLEGHGDVTMDRAGAGVVPGATRFSRVLHERRQQVKGPAKLLQQILGLEAKLRQYAEGERFVEEVERAGGSELFDRVWRGPEWLPTLAEIREPSRWVSRVSAPPALAG